MEEAKSHKEREK